MGILKRFCAWHEEYTKGTAYICEKCKWELLNNFMTEGDND